MCANELITLICRFIVYEQLNWKCISKFYNPKKKYIKKFKRFSMTKVNNYASRIAVCILLQTKISFRGRRIFHFMIYLHCSSYHKWNAANISSRPMLPPIEPWALQQRQRSTNKWKYLIILILLKYSEVKRKFYCSYKLQRKEQSYVICSSKRIYTMLCLYYVEYIKDQSPAFVSLR